MRRHGLFIACIGCILFFATAHSYSQETRDQSAPPVKIIPEFKVDGSIDDVVALLQKADPSLKILLVRDPGASPNQPHVSLNLKNVTILDVLQIASRLYPTIGTDNIATVSGDIHLVKVYNANANGTADPQSAVSMGVKVYNLSSLMEGWIGYNMPDLKVEDAPSAKKKAIEQILSLIQATLALVSQEPGKPVLQIHEATQTLIFKGTAEQCEAVEEAMKALQPTITRRVQGLSRIESDLESLQLRLTSQEREMNRIKAQIGTRPTTQPATSR